MTESERTTLSSIANDVSWLCESFREHKTQVHEDHTRVWCALHGDGSEQKPGIIQRVARLETERSTLKWIVGLLAAGGTATGAALSHLLGTGK